MIDEKTRLITSIADTVADFRKGELGSMTQERVRAWIDQFEPHARVAILPELSYVLKHSYYSRTKVDNFIKDLTWEPFIQINNKNYAWDAVNFLQCPNNGGSQRAMLGLVNQRLRKKYCMSLQICGSTHGPFIYLDDLSFTGMRIKNDLADWIRNHAPTRATVLIVLMAYYQDGYKLINRELQQVCRQANKTITIEWHPGTRQLNNKTDVLKLDQHDQSAGLYSGGFFHSNSHRRVMTEHFLKVGQSILKHSPTLSNKEHMHPLGNSVHDLQGLGTLLITYRNCPNSCPLALWAECDDAAAPWKPLFPRITNRTTARRH